MEKITNIINKIFYEWSLARFVIFFLLCLILLCNFIVTFHNNNNLYIKSNLANFVSLVLCFVIVSIFIKPGKVLETSVNNVATTVENSETAKTDSETKLSAIEESLAHVGEEIDEIVKKSEENANLVGEKLLNEAKIASSIIEENTEKAIENSRVVLKNELLKRASIASIEVAKSHIIDELNNNQDLHNKFIDESLEAIEGVELR
ncbi:MAG: ATP synthase F0 subunit B [bacterium]|nr:ATP synthase F0 subunit B [bacterium]